MSYAAALKRKRGQPEPSVPPADVTTDNDDTAAAADSAAATIRPRSVSLPGRSHPGGSSPAKNPNMVVLSPSNRSRPEHAEAKSAPTSPSSGPSPGAAASQEHTRPVYIPGDPYPRVYPAGDTQAFMYFPRGSTVSQVRFKPPLPK